jgi:Tol biopolymer transport system component
MTMAQRLARRMAISVCVMLGTGEVVTREIPAAADLIARQRIGGDQLDTLKPAAISHDGRLIAFVAQEPLFSHGQCCNRIYVLDRSSGVLTRESEKSDRLAPQADSQAPSLSAAGDVIAFETLAAIPAETGVHSASLHIVVRDRRDATLRTPSAIDGGVPNGLTHEPALSADGRAVAFTSDATNLTSDGDVNGETTDVFLWRIAGSMIVRVSVPNNRRRASSGASHSPSVSATGELVAFASTAQLVPDDTNGVSDVYLRDLRQARTILVSVALKGGAADSASYSPALSSDGRYVAFTSTAGNLVPSDHNQDNDVFVRDLAAGTTSLVSVTSAGASANAWSRRPALSADGRRVVYESLASNLGSKRGCSSAVRDRNLLPDIYLFDRVTGCVSRISGSPIGEWWNASVAPAIAGSGDIVVFSSTHAVGDDDLSSDFDLFAWSGSSARLP